MILDIERDWQKYPGWFSTLHRKDRVMIIADYRLRMRPPEQSKRVRGGDQGNRSTGDARAKFDAWAASQFREGRK